MATIDSGLYKGVEEGLETLWKKGAKNIVYLAEPLKKRDLQKDIRFLAFQEVGKRYGLTDEKILEQTFIGFDEDLWQEEFAKYLAKNRQVDAIFARNDRLAATASQIAQALGRKIPNDIMILGVDNSSISRLITPSITTIEQQKEEMSRAAIELIESMNQGARNGTLQRQETEKVFTTKLIERDSTNRPG